MEDEEGKTFLKMNPGEIRIQLVAQRKGECLYKFFFLSPGSIMGKGSGPRIREFYHVLKTTTWNEYMGQ